MLPLGLGHAPQCFELQTDQRWEQQQVGAGQNLDLPPSLQLPPQMFSPPDAPNYLGLTLEVSQDYLG